MYLRKEKAKHTVSLTLTWVSKDLNFTTLMTAVLEL